MNKKRKFVCPNAMVSPSVGVPVYVTNEAMERKRFPKKHRGGSIYADLSYYEADGTVINEYRVQHAHGFFVWRQEDLIEVGGIHLPVNEDAEDELERIVRIYRERNGE